MRKKSPWVLIVTDWYVCRPVGRYALWDLLQIGLLILVAALSLATELSHHLLLTLCCVVSIVTVGSFIYHLLRDRMDLLSGMLAALSIMLTLSL